MSTTKKKGKKKVSKKVKKTTGGKSKMELAVGVMEKLYFKEGKSRKEILKVLQDKCGLTKSGSSTYYSILKKRIDDDEMN